MHCDGDSWTMTLPQGHTIEGGGGDWPVPERANVLPYNARTTQLARQGDGEVVIDNYDDITSALVDLGVGGVDRNSPVARERGTVGLEDDDNGGFCSLAPPRPSSTLPFSSAPLSLSATLLFGALLLIRRRQR
jgi:hypothetical protein